MGAECKKIEHKEGVNASAHCQALLQLACIKLSAFRSLPQPSGSSLSAALASIRSPFAALPIRPYNASKVELEA